MFDAAMTYAGHDIPHDHTITTRMKVIARMNKTRVFDWHHPIQLVVETSDVWGAVTVNIIQAYTTHLARIQTFDQSPVASSEIFGRFRTHDRLVTWRDRSCCIWRCRMNDSRECCESDHKQNLKTGF